LYEFKDILESEVIDIEKLRKVTFRGRWAGPSCFWSAYFYVVNTEMSLQ